MVLPVAVRSGSTTTWGSAFARILSGQAVPTEWLAPAALSIDPKRTALNRSSRGKANLVHMLEFVQLTEDEKLLVTEGIELHQRLLEKLVDVPTPAGPTPRELAHNDREKRR